MIHIKNNSDKSRILALLITDELQWEDITIYNDELTQNNITTLSAFLSLLDVKLQRARADCAKRAATLQKGGTA